jgi:hypothetical protein
MLPIPSDIGSCPVSPQKSTKTPLGHEVEEEPSFADSIGFTKPLVDSIASHIPLGTSMLPIPSDLGTAGASTLYTDHGNPCLRRATVNQMDPGTGVEACHNMSNDLNCNGSGALFNWEPNIAPDEINVSCPSSPSSRAAGAEPVGVSRPQLLGSASVDSLRSVSEMIRAANLGRASTPQAMTLEFLQDALNADSIDGGSSLRSLLEAPDADELALRLRQLPDLWRTTILKMLEQAEQVQKGVEEMSDEESTRLARIYTS